MLAFMQWRLVFGLKMNFELRIFFANENEKLIHTFWEYFIR